MGHCWTARPKCSGTYSPGGWPACRPAETPLSAAFPQRSTGLVGKALLVFFLVSVARASGATDAWSRAIERGDCVQMARLLEQGAAPERPSLRGKTALMAAAGRACLDLVEALIARGVPVDATNPRHGTALMYAVIGGDPRVVSALIRAGADVDRQGANGWGPLMIAAAKGRTKILGQLLDAGADPNLRDMFGWTPLMRAAFEGRTDTVRRLLAEPRVQINARDYNGATVLHHVAAKGDRALWDLLVAAGADPEIRDLRGRRPEPPAVQTRP